MGNIHVGINTEYSRSSDKPFEWAVEQAAEMGYEYIEPRKPISSAPKAMNTQVQRLCGVAARARATRSNVLTPLALSSAPGRMPKPSSRAR